MLGKSMLASEPLIVDKTGTLTEGLFNRQAFDSGVVMATGDGPTTAKAVGKRLGIDELDGEVTFHK